MNKQINPPPENLASQEEIDRLEKVLWNIGVISRREDIRVFVSGGILRNRLLGIPMTRNSDIYLTTEKRSDSLILPYIIANSKGFPDPIVFKESGIVCIHVESFNAEFGGISKDSHWVMDELQKQQLPLSNLMVETYRCDLTIDTILQDVLTKQYLDLTQRGMSDIKNRFIKTPLDPMKTIRHNPWVIFGAMESQLELEGTMDDDLNKMIHVTAPVVSSLSLSGLRKHVEKILSLQGGQEALDEFGVSEYIPKEAYEKPEVEESYRLTEVVPQDTTVSKPPEPGMIRQLVPYKTRSGKIDYRYIWVHPKNVGKPAATSPKADMPF